MMAIHNVNVNLISVSVRDERKRGVGGWWERTGEGRGKGGLP